MGNSMVAFIFCILQILTLFGAPQGSKWGSKWSKSAHFHTINNKKLQIANLDGLVINF